MYSFSFAVKVKRPNCGINNSFSGEIETVGVVHAQQHSATLKVLY